MYLVAKPPKLVLLGHDCRYRHTDNLLDLVEDNTARLSYPEEAHHCSYDDKESKKLPVRARKIEDVMVLDALGGVASGLLLLLLLASI